jgi:hypothetical protein
MHSHHILALLMAAVLSGACLSDHGIAWADEVAASASGLVTPLSSTPPAPDDPILEMLRSRVEQRPLHSDSWRMLGKALADRGDAVAAIETLNRALEIDPTNAAAHFNLGQVFLSQTKTDVATTHFEACVSIAPDSEYANEIFARNLLTPSARASTILNPKGDYDPALPTVQDPSSPASLNVQPAGYEIQSFDGADDLERRFDQLEADSDPVAKRLRLFCELGILYNSNISLTPISRELLNVDAESFQAIFNPEVEWIALSNELWRSGPLLRSYSALNESNQQEFNLFSVQPGWFIERDRKVGDGEWIGRIDYVYATDLLDGNRIGDRHSSTASLIMIRPDLDVIYTYITASFTDFVDDGAIATETSLDGPSITGGVSRFFQTKKPWLPTYTLGVDLESADTRGSDFRYRAITAHGGMTFQLHERWRLIPTAGLGYRDYYAFTGDPSRDELTSRIHLRLQYQMNTTTSVSLVSGYDRFASDNELFDAQRTQAGIVMTVNY